MARRCRDSRGNANDTSELHRADFSRRVGTIYDIRLQIYRKKFFIKFLNNFIAQLTPFFFYLIGGYLVIRGSLTFGALVAVLAAYKDLSSPWKELLDWYQQKEDTRIKYDQLIEQFRPAGMLPETLQTPAEAPVPRLSGTIVASNLTLQDESGVKSVDGASFRFDIKERIALVGGAGSGAEEVARMLARLIQPTAGVIHIGEHNLAMLAESITGQRIAYVGNHTALVNGTIRENLLYGLKHRPVELADNLEEGVRRSAAICFRGAAIRQHDKLPRRRLDRLRRDRSRYARGIHGLALQVLNFVELEADVFALGFRGPWRRGPTLNLPSVSCKRAGL